MHLLGELSTRAAAGAVLVLCAGLGCSPSIEPRLPPGSPPLHRAAALDDVEGLRRELPGGVDSRGPYGWTALHYAAVFGAPRAAAFLLGSRAHLDPLDATGMTPLHWAARKGNLAVVEALLRAGAEVMARNKYDQTPLHEASTTEVASALLQRGASLKAVDIDGMTPLHTAPSREVAQLLISKGADVNAAAKDGRTPMDMPPAPRARTP